jgi:hypothetical protein
MLPHVAFKRALDITERALYGYVQHGPLLSCAIF